jgi:cytosine/creatinine deaminase
MLLRNALLADGGRVDVRIDDGRVDQVRPAGTVEARPDEPVEELEGYVLLPGPVDPHAHLDKALLGDRAPNPHGDLLNARAAMRAIYGELNKADIARRAREAALIAVAYGTTAIRSHVDCGVRFGLTSVEALLEVREGLRGYVDVQVSASVRSPIVGVAGAENRAYLEAALEMGADGAGACPHLDPDPAGCINACLDLATKFERPIDLHVDETLDPSALTLSEYVRAVAARRFPYGAVAGHCVSLGVQPEAVQAQLAAGLAEAGIAVVANPLTNLYLQARGATVAPPRGLTAVRPLLAAGVTLAAGGDNLRDPFNAMGRGDTLETAALMVMAGHLTPEEAYASVSSSARKAMGLPPIAVQAGSPADLLAVRGRSLTDAIAAASEDRLVLKSGRVVCRTTVSRTLSPLSFS